MKTGSGPLMNRNWGAPLKRGRFHGSRRAQRHSSYSEIIVIDIHYGFEHSITDVIKRRQLILLGFFYIAHASVSFPTVQTELSTTMSKV